MAHGGGKGGARPGAGRKKGSTNQKTREIAEITAAARHAGVTPIEYMLQVMRDDQADVARRDDMAKAAAPYVHPKLAAVEVAGKGGGPVQVTIAGMDAGLL